MEGERDGEKARGMKEWEEANAKKLEKAMREFGLL